MKATDLLIKQHHAIARLFKAIEVAETQADKKTLFVELASTLTAHDGIEREIFYPACQDAMGLNDELGEALVEHGVIEFCLYQANEAVGKPDFDFKCKVLKELVEHHVKEEEDEFLPKTEDALGSGLLEALGEEMEDAFDEAREEDFRGPLYENLRQVFAGVLQPVSPDAKHLPTARRSA